MKTPPNYRPAEFVSIGAPYIEPARFRIESCGTCKHREESSPRDVCGHPKLVMYPKWPDDLKRRTTGPPLPDRFCPPVKLSGLCDLWEAVGCTDTSDSEK